MYTIEAVVLEVGLEPTKAEAGKFTVSRRIDDSFQKIVIVGDSSARYQNDEGIIFMDIYDFLMDIESVI